VRDLTGALSICLLAQVQSFECACVGAFGVPPIHLPLSLALSLPHRRAVLYSAVLVEKSTTLTVVGNSSHATRMR
jgi:hypothetical protein